MEEIAEDAAKAFEYDAHDGRSDARKRRSAAISEDISTRKRLDVLNGNALGVCALRTDHPDTEEDRGEEKRDNNNSCKRMCAVSLHDYDR